MQVLECSKALKLWGRGPGGPDTFHDLIVADAGIAEVHRPL